MRHVFDSRQVAHLWANEAQDRARNSTDSFSFRGAYLYSYSTIIARIVRNEQGERAYLVSTHSYSATTNGKHYSARRGAITADARVFHFEYVDDSELNASWLSRRAAEYAERIAKAELTAKRARKDKDWRLRELANLVAEANEFARFFGFAERFSPEFVARLNSEAAAEREARKIERERQEAEYRQREAARLAKEIPEWLAGERNYLTVSHDAPALLRLSSDGSEVETSRGATVPVSHARRLYLLWTANAVRGGQRVGHFTTHAANAEGITIGCHYITRAEADRFAASMGWTVEASANV